MNTPSDETRELELVEKVDLRLALADTADKFEKNLEIFLAPLLLKLASNYGQVRANVFNSLKNILSRLSSLNEVKLPVQKLIEQAKNVTNILPNCNDNSLISNVSLYSLLLASKGIDRLTSSDLDVEERKKLVPLIMNGISSLPPNTTARLFHILCKILLKWIPPLKGSSEEELMIQFLKLNDDNKDLNFLLEYFTKFFLLIPAKPDPQSGIISRGYNCPGLSADDVAFFTYNAGVSFTKDQFLQFKRAIFKFVCNGFVSNDQLLVKFLSVVSTDNSDLGDQAIQFLKRLQTPYEDEDFILYLIDLFTGNRSKNIPPVKSELQSKILTILNRSIIATTNKKKISLICSIGLHSDQNKLRSLCLNFIRHVAKYNYKGLLPEPLADGNNENNVDFPINIAALIRNNLHSEGWPKLELGSSTPTFSTTIQQRQLQYETLGDILKKDFNLVKDLSYIEFLFDSLRGDMNEFSQSIQEALLGLIRHLSKLPVSSKETLRKLLRNNLSDDTELLSLLSSSENKKQRNEREDKIMTVRYVSIKYANATFDFSDVEARLFNVWGTSRSNRFDIIEEASKGLNPYWYNVNNSITQTEVGTISRTDEKLGSTVITVKFPSFQEFSVLLLDEIAGSKELPNATIRSSLNVAIRFAEQCLISEATYGKTTSIIQDENWSLHVEKALEIDEDVTKMVYELVHTINQRWYIDFLNLICSEFIHMTPSGDFLSISKYDDIIFGEVALSLVRLSNSTTLKGLQSQIPNFLKYLEGVKVTNDRELEVSAHILGILCTTLEKNDSLLHDIITSLRTGEISLPTLYASSYVLPRLFWTHGDEAFSDRELEALIEALLAQTSKTTHTRIILRLLCEILKYGLLLQLTAEKRETMLNRFIDQFKKKLINNELNVELWGYLSLYAKEFDLQDVFLEGILDSHNSKQIEYIFAAGESLSVVAGGWFSHFLSKQIDISIISSSLLKNKFSNENTQAVLEKILITCDTTKPSLRRAACIWLLSLTQYLRDDEIIKNRSKDIHFKFMKFLTINDEFIQDSAARGLSLIYSIGNSDLKEEMVKGLLKSFTDSTSAMSLNSGSVAGETELFERGVMDTGDGSISTYKDIMNLASEVGDPSLVYKFMSLAKSTSLWSSRKGLAFGLGAVMSKFSLENMLLEDTQTAKRLIPVLYRYRFDPYSTVSRSMNDIWNTLVSDSSAVIVTKYFNDILNELLKSMGNKEWRVREGATAGLLQLVQTQPLEKFSNKILDIWTMGFRIIDDIKESVREIGTKFMNSLSKVLVRSIESSTSRDKTEQIISIILPFLLGTKGLESDADDVRKFALATLMELIKKSGTSIRQFSPKLMYEFTLLFSSIEPQVINYLALNSKNYNIDSNIIDSHRKNAVSSSPLFDTIQKLIQNCDSSQIEEIVDYCIKSVKKSVGLPSKVAASQVIILIIKRFVFEIKPFTGKLLKICLNMFDDRNESINLSFAQAFGYLYKVTSIEKAVKYSKKLNEKYFQPTSENDKKTIGVAINSILNYAPGQFETIADIFMPLIFIASNDTEDEINQLYSKIWTEASSSGSGSIRLYLSEILSLLSSNIKSTDFTVRKTCAKSILVICDNVDVSISKANIGLLLNLTIGSLIGRSWEGKELLFGALVNSSIKFQDFIKEDTEMKIKLDKSVTIEILRTNLEYVRKIVLDYANYLKVFNVEDSVAIQEYMNLIDKIINSFEKTRDLLENDKYEEDQDEIGNDTKRIKPNVSISEKSTERNFKTEDYIINLIKACVSIYKINNSGEVLRFIISRSIDLFDNEKFIYTWRTQLAVNEIGIDMLEQNNQIDESLITDYWNFMVSKCNTKETILNVKLKGIKFGSLLIVKVPSIKNQVERQLIEIGQVDPTPRILGELKNIGL